MAKTFTTDSEVEEMAAAAMRQYHPDLHGADVTLQVLMAAAVDKDGDDVPALKKNGLPAAALVKIASLEDRARGIPDVKILVDQYAWDRMPESSRTALLDHELEHVAIVVDKDTGKLKRDDLGRPRLRLRPHDWELTGFVAVAERHREAAVEVRALRAFKAEQFELFGDSVGA